MAIERDAGPGGIIGPQLPEVQPDEVLVEGLPQDPGVFEFDDGSAIIGEYAEEEDAEKEMLAGEETTTGSLELAQVGFIAGHPTSMPWRMIHSPEMQSRRLRQAAYTCQGIFDS